VRPQLGVILAARSRPVFIMILRGRPDGEALPGRFLGIADETAGLRAALAETAPPMVAKENEDVGPLYMYELSGPPRTSRYLAKFAAESKHLVIDLYLPGAQTNLPSERFVVTRPLRRLHAETPVVQGVVLTDWGTTLAEFTANGSSASAACANVTNDLTNAARSAAEASPVSAERPVETPLWPRRCRQGRHEE
jgi:hypothetical protein